MLHPLVMKEMESDYPTGVDYKPPLLHDVFNYNLGMMKEQNQTPAKFKSVQEIIAKYDEEEQSCKENNDPLHNNSRTDLYCGNVNDNGTANKTTSLPFSSPLLDKVWNFDLGMMTETRPHEKRLSSQKSSPNPHNEPPSKRGKRALPRERTPLSPLLNANNNLNNVTFPAHLGGMGYDNCKTQCDKRCTNTRSVQSNDENTNGKRKSPIVLPCTPNVDDYIKKSGVVTPKLFTRSKPFRSPPNNMHSTPSPTAKQVQTRNTADRGPTTVRKTTRMSQNSPSTPTTYEGYLKRPIVEPKTLSPFTPSLQSMTQSPLTPLETPLPRKTTNSTASARNKGKEPMYPDDASVRLSSRYGNKSGFKMPQTKLDFSGDDIGGSTTEFNNDIEYSVIRDCHDEGYFSSEDEVDDVIYDEADMESENIEVVKEYASLGPPNVQCKKCLAWMWKEERVNKSTTRGEAVFSLCCSKGQIKLPPEKPTPSYIWQLHNDKDKKQRFRDGIRLYNSIFAFTSTGGNVDNSVNNGGAPYVYRLNGQNHHLFGSLIPDKGKDPRFCQLYIYDTQNELSNRLKWIDVETGDQVDAEIVESLGKMLDENNELVKEFRSARDRFEKDGVTDLEIILKVSRAENGRENHVGPSDEVAGIMVGDLDETDGSRDIIIHSKINSLERISDIHPKLMSLQYPLLFPYGGDGFHKNIPFVKDEKNSEKKREMISMRDYYSYKFQVRTNEGITPRLGGRLYQQYVVDAFSTIEQARLWWFRTNQTTLRSEVYTSIQKSLKAGTSETTNLGKGFILPAGFVGSRRYMQQNFQDALAVCRHIGHPDIFLTMTTNPMWDEIIQMLKLIPPCSPQNSPDVIARVFKLKLEQLIEDIKKNSYFGTCLGVMYVVEFQKRGLPHVHMLIWLDAASKLKLQQNVDKYVSAEIPDPIKDPIGYAAVKAHMIHGPCGHGFPKAGCMKNFNCIRHFPKKYCPATIFDQSGFPIYKRRKGNITVTKGKTVMDNKWVVPYNRDLLVKYQCHINVEICCHARSLKYLFKYCLKGHDRATVEIRGKRRTAEYRDKLEECEDEIQTFFDGRYICGCEAAYRIFGFNIHYRSLSVLRLSFHLPGNKFCTFKATEPLPKVEAREKERHSQLEAFFILNSEDMNARKYLYDEIPEHYVWNDADRVWNLRKRGKQIGRLAYSHHSSGELWYLRLLLTKVRGPTSFEALRTVKGTVFKNFHGACKEYGFLDDDNEWQQVLQQCSLSGFPQQIRQLFVHIMVNCKVSDLKSLWNSHWHSMVDDILLIQRELTGNPLLILNEMQQQFFALAEIHKLLKSIGKSLKDYHQMPQPPSSYLDCSDNNLILEETSYDVAAMEAEFQQLFSCCNTEQLQVYNSVMDSVENNKGGVFFVFGSGGCGKTYMWRTMISKLRSVRKIVLPVASSGIAATLMPGGRTAHSRFKIPIVLDDFSMCSISHNSDIAELIKRTSLIIWDEAPMQHRYSFECLDRSLRDIMKAVDPQRYYKPFGGITIVLGGDFRQILPVIPGAGRGQVVSSSITNSKLWKIATVFKLMHNMRLNKGKNADEVKILSDFAEWVLQVGDGKVRPPANNDGHEYAEPDIPIPKEFCNLTGTNSVEKMIESTYPDFMENYKNPEYLSERAILTPTNATVGHVNSAIVDKLPGEVFSYFSIDTAEDFPGTDANLQASFPPEYLNSFNIPGMPLHELKLKVGAVVMLMRNLNQTLGLCNGTRMMITKCLKHCVECEVIAGQFKGTRHFIPRMELSPTDTKLPFKLCRKQMPLQVCYTMTINKAQGQSLEKVALYLPKPVFTHGQLYVAVSRVTSPQGLKLFINDEEGNTTNITQNVVYKEVFYNIPII